MSVAIVTGAARGIGAASARTLAAEGYAVALIDIRFDEAERIAQRIIAAGGAASAYQLDITDRLAVDAAVAQIRIDFGAITCVVNNAGIAVFADPLELTDAQWRQCMAVDLDGAWYVTRAALPDLKNHQGASVVNIASVHAHQVLRGAFPYPVAKHALLGMTRSLAIEYADQGVRVNAICPGYVDTPINDELFDAMADPAAAKMHAHALHPPGRMGTADEIAAVVRFLVSKDASFINGASIMVDGGRSLLYHD